MARASATAPVEVSESGIQVAVVDYCRARKGGREHVIHIPNEGKRSRIGHYRQKRQGLTPGASDLFFPVAHGYFIGMWMELKRKGEPLKPHQDAFLTEMAMLGHYCTWSDSIDGAIAHIERYFSLPARSPLFDCEHPTPEPHPQACFLAR